MRSTSKLERFLQWLYNELADNPKLAKKVFKHNKKTLTNRKTHGILIV